MKPKGFFTKQTNRENASFVSKSMLYVGTIILLSSMTFMALNLDEAGTWLYVWLLFMIVGILLVFFSLIYRKQSNNRNRNTPV